MMTYKDTHPWITFEFKLAKIPWNLWIELGECQSKCEHIRDVPILPETRDRLTKIYLAKGVHATTAIEGNPLSEEEVFNLLYGKLELPPSRAYQEREIKNILGVYNKVIEIIKNNGTPELTVRHIKEINKQILEGLPTEDYVIPGETTSVQVGVPGYRGTAPQECEHLLEELCDWLNSDNFNAPAPSMAFIFGIIKAAISHLYIAWIHPFGDGNGRTARAVEFIILISAGVPATAAHLLSNHYNRTRLKYYQELKKTSDSKGDIVPFLQYSVEGFLDGLREQVARIQSQQWEMVCHNAIFNMVKGKQEATRKRKQTLALALFAQTEPMSIRQIAQMPQLVGLYPAGRNTILRHDIDELINEGLLSRSKGKIQAYFELISGFKNLTIKGQVQPKKLQS